MRGATVIPRLSAKSDTKFNIGFCVAFSFLRSSCSIPGRFYILHRQYRLANNIVNPHVSS